MQKKSLKNWLEHIESFHPNEIELGLERIKQVAKKLDTLNLKSKIIIVGGTNGKGSTVATLEALALKNHYSVGVYTSPHLLSFNERIKLNGKNVSDQQLVAAFEKIESVRKDTALTFFEFTTLAALLIFKAENLDLIVLEVGLGGRLDAVNIVEPDVSMITTIAKDHMDWLGNDLSAIAKEKAGISRPQKTTLIGDKKSFDLIKNIDSNTQVNFQLVENLNNDDVKKLQNFEVNPLMLIRQNIELAINGFELLEFKNQHSLASILNAIVIQGRLQRLLLPIPTLVDVAHNHQAVLNLAQQIDKYKTAHGLSKVLCICGMMADKAIEEVLQAINPIIDDWSFVDLQGDRAISAKDLQLKFEKQDHAKTSQCFASVAKAYQYCENQADKETLILVFGSFITVANMLQYQQSKLMS